MGAGPSCSECGAPLGDQAVASWSYSAATGLPNHDVPRACLGFVGQMIAALRADREATFAVLRAAGIAGEYAALADAVRQLAQVALSERQSAEALEARVEALVVANAAHPAVADRLDAAEQLAEAVKDFGVLIERSDPEWSAIEASLRAWEKACRAALRPPKAR